MTPDGSLNLVREAIIPSCSWWRRSDLRAGSGPHRKHLEPPPGSGADPGLVPRSVAVLLAVMIFGGWIMKMAVEFTLKLWGEGLLLF